MKKAELIERVAKASGLQKIQAESCLNSLVEVVTEELVDGKKEAKSSGIFKLGLLGFGRLSLRYKQERKGRNPKTKEEITIKPSYGIQLQASKQFKEALNS